MGLCIPARSRTTRVRGGVARLLLCVLLEGLVEGVVAAGDACFVGNVSKDEEKGRDDVPTPMAMRRGPFRLSAMLMIEYE